MMDRDKKLARLTKEQRDRMFKASAPRFRNPFFDPLYLQRGMFKPLLAPLFGGRDRGTEEETK